MSRRTRLQAARIVLAALGLIALLSVMAHGQPPKAPTAKAQVTAGPPLNRPAPAARRTPASFTPQMSFGEAIDILRNSTTPPLNLVVLWRQIGENAGVYRDTPIGIDGIPGLRVRQYLDMLVASLSAGAPVKLGYAVRDGVVTVGTTDALPLPKRVTRVYDVSDLVAEPARYFFPPIGFGGIGYGGGPMMGPAGGSRAGFIPGMPYASTGTGDRGLSGAIGGFYRATSRPGTSRR
jgi:hypothetical protein